MKTYKNTPSLLCTSLSSESLFCKKHFLKQLTDSLEIQDKTAYLFSRKYSIECSCESEDLLLNACCSDWRNSDYKKIADNIDRSIVTLMEYAELINLSLNISKRTINTKSQNLQIFLNKSKPKLILKSINSSNIIYEHSELNHKLSRLYLDDILKINSSSLLFTSYINRISLKSHKDSLKCLKDKMTDEVKTKLFKIILESKKYKNLKYAASNAITILNYSKYKFIDKDFRGIQIEGADLSEALIINTNFEGSNLKGVDFSYANIYDSNFRNCDMTDVWFGQLPPVISKCAIDNLAFSPCGNYLAYDCCDAVVMHDIKKGIALKEFKHEASISAISFSKDGVLLAIADSNSILNLWDIKLSERIVRFTGHTDIITSIAFSPIGNLIATGSYNGQIRIWNLETYMLACCINNSYNSVSSVAYSPSGKYFAFGAFDHSAIVTYSESVSAKKWLFAHPDFVRTVSFSPCSEYLISSCDDLVMRIWDIILGHLYKFIQIDYSPLRLLRLSQRSYSPSEDQAPLIKFWTRCGHFEIKWFNEQLFNMLSVCYSPNGEYIAIKKSDKSEKALEIWDIRSLEEHSSFYKEITSISFSYDGKYIAIANTSKIITIKNADTKENEFKLIGSRGIIMFVKFLKTRYLLISLCSANYITVWDVINQCPLQEFTKWVFQISAIDVSLSGNFLGAGWRRSSDIIVFDLESSLTHFYLKESGETVTCVKFSPCEKYLASSYNSKKLILWDLSTKKEVLSLEGHENNLLCLSFVQSSKYLASADMSGRVILWDVDTQWKILEIQADDRMIPAMAVSLCGDYLITGSLNGCVKVWNTWEGTLIKELKWHSNTIDSLQFLNNKELLFTSVSADTTFKICRI